MSETTASALTEDQAAYVAGLMELAGWQSDNPDAIPMYGDARILLALHANDEVEDFAARHGREVAYDEEGNASVDLMFGPRVVLHVYGYVDFAEHCERAERRDAERFAAEHGLALVPAETTGEVSA